MLQDPARQADAFGWPLHRDVAHHDVEPAVGQRLDGAFGTVGGGRHDVLRGQQLRHGAALFAGLPDDQGTGPCVERLYI